MTRATLYINRDADDNLYVRYLNWNGNRWNWNYNWLDNDWNDSNPAALLATFFISLPAACWESFVYEVAHSNRRAFGQFRQSLEIEKDIFYYPTICFPTISLAESLECLLF